jgi:hypothetical protein
MDDTAREMKHADLLYDYIKFHLSLYLATPAALAIVANALELAKWPEFLWGLTGLFVACVIAAVSASWMLASAINVDWPTSAAWQAFGRKAQAGWRRFIHHYLYWAGLASGVGGLILAACRH